ncbi:hypothetical protein LX36DRAFT_311470 [Colletotrichum falcatum]|nr:hypothetical protein LX36DRAFT_311470 [Colletotrichum falcatum]
MYLPNANRNHQRLLARHNRDVFAVVIALFYDETALQWGPKSLLPTSALTRRVAFPSPHLSFFQLLYHQLEMADLQLLSSLLSENRGKNDELSELQRVAIVAAVGAGLSQRQAAEVFGCSKYTVTNTLYKFRHNHTFKSQPRKGRLDKLSKREKRSIIRSAKQDFRQPYSDLAKA